MKRSFATAIAALFTLVLFAACNRDGGGGGSGSANTQWGTPRNETLIVEFQVPISTPGQFNTHMQGTSAGSGIHQLMSAMMWEIDTMTGEQFGVVAASLPQSNADFTEHIIPIREGIYWSDGQPLTAHDVAFTWNMMRNTPTHSSSGFYQLIFASIEATNDYEIRIVTNESFPRLALQFGSTIWGNNLRIVPAHIYSQVDDPTSFRDEEPVVAGPYTVHSFDPLGTWVRFDLRDDWQRSTVGVVTKGPNAPPAHVVFRSLGDDSTRQMLAVQNEVDVMVEVTPEQLNFMRTQNPNIRAWYEEFPYGTSDDPAAKGITFMADKEPFNNRYFRWGVAAALNFDEITMFVFEGIGRASPLPLITQTSAFNAAFMPQLLPWLEAFEIPLESGRVYKPFDTGFAERHAARMEITGSRDELINTFGYGVWRHDPEAATELFQMAGLELRGNQWFFNDQPFRFNMTFLAGSEIQAARSVEIAFNQLRAFGLDVTLEGQAPGAWDNNSSLGNFEVAGYWPFGFITRDIYAQVQGWAMDIMAPVGEIGSGNGQRWRSPEATRIIREMERLHPDDPATFQLAVDLIKHAVEELPTIGFHSGVKFVPINTTYWTNFPTAENPYNGPWWWWSVFGHMLPYLEPVQ